MILGKRWTSFFCPTLESIMKKLIKLSILAITSAVSISTLAASEPFTFSCPLARNVDLQKIEAPGDAIYYHAKAPRSKNMPENLGSWVGEETSPAHFKENGQLQLQSVSGFPNQLACEYTIAGFKDTAPYNVTIRLTPSNGVDNYCYSGTVDEIKTALRTGDSC
jgi:hypothetical protein